MKLIKMIRRVKPMRSLNLCIDIDGTVTEPYYWLQKANEYFGGNIKPKDVHDYEINKVYNVEESRYKDFYRIFGMSLHRDSKMRIGASKIINKLYKYHQIHFVTAREYKMKEVSIQWLDKFKIPMDSISLLGTHDKVKRASELDCDIFIEDRYENAIQLAEAGFDVLLIDCSYNKGVLPINVKRIKCWSQIENYINVLSLQFDSLKLA
jgi:uncharacterized HAD superfamily protein